MQNRLALTEDQQKIYNQLIDFIKTDKEKEISLIGYAGVGKTMLITRLINDIISSKLCKRIAVCSPTHKSLNVIKSKLFTTSEKTTISSNIDIITIHRLLNYQYHTDNTGKKYYAKGKVEPNCSIYNVIIIDECSMLSKQIIDDIETEINKPKNKNIKFIFSSDPCQLPPVGEISSAIFSKKIKTLTLDKIIRTKSQNIMELSNAHRKWIITNEDKNMPHLVDYEDKNIILHNSKNTEIWLKKFINYLKFQSNNQDFDNKSQKLLNINNEKIPETPETPETPENLNNNIILTWTNKKCNEYNDYIRHRMFNKKKLNKYEIGEILIFNDFYRILINTETEENKIISFYTSEQVKLQDIRQDKLTFQKIKNLKNVELPEDISLKFKKTISKINKILITKTIDVYYMTVKKISELKTQDDNTELYEILTIHNDSEKEYEELKEIFEQIMIEFKNTVYKMINDLKTPTNTNDSSFNMIKTEYMNIIENKINRMWKDWQTNVIDKFAQLNYGYCITVHKSQGSTFKNVFIDIKDIFANYNQQEKLKCLYTAITRSSHSLELLI
jgi:hypothetical protein